MHEVGVANRAPGTKITSEAFFRLFTKYNTPENYPPYGTYLPTYCSSRGLEWLLSITTCVFDVTSYLPPIHAQQSFAKTL